MSLEEIIKRTLGELVMQNCILQARLAAAEAKLNEATKHNVSVNGADRPADTEQNLDRQ